MIMPCEAKTVEAIGGENQPNQPNEENKHTPNEPTSAVRAVPRPNIMIIAFGAGISAFSALIEFVSA